jgi:hypothetical protein
VPGQPGPTAPPADPSSDGDSGGGALGVAPGSTPIPADAQAVIDSIVRTGGNDDHLLVAGERALLDAGVPPDEAARLAYGSFPVAGPAAWVDDWYAPRFTGTTFRYHLGLDLIAAYGTPLRAPLDGIARISESALGGLAVEVVEPDGTFFYMCHMSATADGLTTGQPVHRGDVVGYVGQSGDATGPHLHFGIYQGGTTPIPPKPIVDQWVADQVDALPMLIAARTGGTPRPLIAAGIVRDLAATEARVQQVAAGPSRTDLLFATSANPAGGTLQLAQAGASQLAASIDWNQRASFLAAWQREWTQAEARAWRVLEPLTPRALRDAMAPSFSP